jgi:hypothetical protein
MFDFYLLIFCVYPNKSTLLKMDLKIKEELIDGIEQLDIKQK